MVYGDRNYNQEAIANLNSTSPLSFPDTISAEDLARDLDLFTNTQFFDFDFGGPASNFTALESSHRPQQSDIDHPEGNLSQLPSISNDSALSHFQFLSDPPLFDMNTLGGSEEESTTAKRRRITDSQSVKPEDTPASVTSMDDTARAAAEEDKRRRNTLASARFRQKKKMREQALEKDHKEMAARLEKMENRIKELELENKWLRGLVVQSKP